MRSIRRMATGLVAGALVMGSATVVAAPVQASAPLPTFGVQFHGTWGNYDDATRARVLDTLKANGATAVRIDVSWAMLQPTSTSSYSAWGVGMVDKAITMASTRGLKPMVMLWLAPKWANGSTDERVPVTSSAGLTGLRSVSTWLARKYKGVVDGWEVWNEPNSSDFMRGASPTAYAKMLDSAFHGFKAGDPGARVIFGGTMYTDTAWIQRALSAGAARHYDVMGVHPYQGVGDEPPEAADDGTQWRMRHIPTLKAAMDAVGDTGKPMWFTEFGWRAGSGTTSSTPNWLRAVSEPVQADFLARTIRMVAAEWPYVTKVFWYRDRNTGTDPGLDQYGLINPDGSVRPALAIVPSVYSGAPTAVVSQASMPIATPVVDAPGAATPAEAAAAPVVDAAIPPTAVVVEAAVKSVSRGSKLRVDMAPDLARGSWKFQVQRLTKSGSWKSLSTYRTRGAAETRTVNLPKGTYRVVVHPEVEHTGTVSAGVHLKR